jgi:hypothetical protein
LKNLRVENKPISVTSHPDFDFVKDKSLADIAVGRVGCGPAGKVFLEFAERSTNSHYLLSVKDDSVIDRLREVSYLMVECSREEVSKVPSLSKPDLIRIYSGITS